MFLRRAVVALLKRIQTTPHIVATTRPRISIAVPGREGYSSSRRRGGNFLWILISGNAALILGSSSSMVLAEDVATGVTSEGDIGGPNVSGLQRIEDGSVVSNEHTSKWRIFTDNGRDFFLQGKLDEAERFFLSAIEEAKEGFGEKDPHVASACNNLAELYRVRKAYNKAEPLYQEAIKILEESFGTEDVRVGAALHNLGKFYIMQRKLQEAQVSYEDPLQSDPVATERENVPLAPVLAPAPHNFTQERMELFKRMATTFAGQMVTPITTSATPVAVDSPPITEEWGQNRISENGTTKILREAICR
ncbi:hypothetical protein Dimus_033226 [Dionaea muscipula]